MIAHKAGPRRPRAAGPLLLGACALAAATSARGQVPAPAPPAGATAFVAEGGARAVFFPPAEAAPAGERPLTVMLHGMCATPEWECPFFRKGATASGWLLCVAGPALCGGGPGSRWSGSPGALSRAVGASVDELGRRLPAGSKAGGRALVGYSLGASAASSIIATAAPGEWSSLMVVNASAVPTPAQLRRAGVKRVALVAGERDGTAPKLKRSAKALADAGVDAKYFSLGPVGHYFGETTEAALDAPLRWLHGRE